MVVLTVCSVILVVIQVIFLVGYYKSSVGYQYAATLYRTAIGLLVVIMDNYKSMKVSFQPIIYCIGPGTRLWTGLTKHHKRLKHCKGATKDLLNTAKYDIL